jgi:rod shape-determining protein MreC
MELLFSRYRNLTVLLLVLFSQLLLLAYQVRSSTQLRTIRVWAVTGVAPFARLLESSRSSVYSFFNDYFILLDVREENRRYKAETNRLKLENNFLKTELSTADRARALIEFKGRSPSKTLAARIIATSTSAKTVVLVDRGTSDGVYKGMAVITGDGIIGKVIDSFPSAAQVQLITDSLFGAGVVSQKNRVYGTLKGQGHNRCVVDRVQNEDKVEMGEMFFTTGEDRIFPKGLPVGRVVSVQTGPIFKSIEVVPAGLANGIEEILIVLEGVHQDVPLPVSQADQITSLQPPPATTGQDGRSIPVGTPSNGVLSTDADRMAERYTKKEQQSGVKFGTFGSAPPNFSNLPPADGVTQTPPPQRPPAPVAKKPVPDTTPDPQQ